MALEFTYETHWPDDLPIELWSQLGQGQVYVLLGLVRPNTGFKLN